MFSRLTDLGLRRIYKFLIKRTIGKYLENELLIDQIEVISGEGVVNLTDITLNCSIINDEFCKFLPIQFASISISLLKIYLSYSSFVTKSCRFVVENIDVVIVPNEKIINNSSPPSSPIPVEPCGLVQNNFASIGTKYSEEEQGINFIANWIELVIAGLQLSIINLNVIFKAINSPSVEKKGKKDKKIVEKKPSVVEIHFFIPNLDYFNCDPSMLQNEKSMEFSMKTVECQDTEIFNKLTSKKVFLFLFIFLRFCF
jgi:hypothetical protein